MGSKAHEHLEQGERGQEYSVGSLRPHSGFAASILFTGGGERSSRFGALLRSELKL
jgi:hypothetical protein